MWRNNQFYKIFGEALGKELSDFVVCTFNDLGGKAMLKHVKYRSKE